METCLNFIKNKSHSYIPRIEFATDFFCIESAYKPLGYLDFEWKQTLSSVIIQCMRVWQMRNVSPGERVYTLRSRAPPALPPSPLSLPPGGAEPASFVCYVCGARAASGQLRLLYCCANPDHEPYYPFITALKPPSDASPISPQGNVVYEYILL